VVEVQCDILTGRHDAMYEQFSNFGGLREDPFHVCPDPRFYCSTPGHDTALTELMLGIESRQGILLLTGEAGTGKTTILNLILEWQRKLGHSTAFIYHSRVQPIGLLQLILSDFGLPCDSKSKRHLLRTLRHWLVHRRAAKDLPVLIVDEAQALPPQTLDEIRVILDTETPRGNLLQIVLSGQPELDDKLRLPVLQQLRQRIISRSRLETLTERDTFAYIVRRLALAGSSDASVFSNAAVQSIHAISRGIPRVVNLLCAHALISVSNERGRVITPETIQRIASDFDLCSAPLATAANDTKQHRYAAPPIPKVKDTEVLETLPVALAEGEAVPTLPGAAPTTAAAVPPAAACTVPFAAPANPVVGAVPVAPAAPKGATRESPARPWKYRRGHRSRLAVTALARNSVAIVRQARQAVWGILVASVHRVRRASCLLRDYTWKQSFLDVKFDLRPTLLRQLLLRYARCRAFFERITVKEQAARVAERGLPSQFVKYWRKYGSSSRVMVWARNSLGSVVRVRFAVQERLVKYFRDVLDSFVRDCQIWFRYRPGLFRVSSLRISASVVGATVDVDTRKARSVVPRNLVALVRWLRQPMRPPRTSSHGSSVHRPSS